MKRVLVIGATSAIAQAYCRLGAREGRSYVLTGRDLQRLESIAADLRVRGASRVEIFELDVLNSRQHAPLFDSAFEALGEIDVVLIAHGTLPVQADCESNMDALRLAIETNATSVMALASIAAARLLAQRSGTLAVIGSVAGDRGRQSNYVYGAAKAAVATFLQGLRNRLAPAGIHVVTIKPGFVDTPMTGHITKGPLWASPDAVARGIDRAIDQRRDVVYLPGFWRWIMLVIRLIPERIFKGMKL